MVSEALVTDTVLRVRTGLASGDSYSSTCASVFFPALSELRCCRCLAIAAAGNALCGLTARAAIRSATNAILFESTAVGKQPKGRENKSEKEREGKRLRDKKRESKRKKRERKKM